MSDKHHMKLQISEGIVTQSAAMIYAAYITAGKVQEGSEKEWIARSLREAILIARTADENIVSDDEVS